MTYTPRLHVAPRLVNGAQSLCFCALTFLSTPTTAPAQDKVTTLAGSPLDTGATDGAPILARFSDPTALAADSAGNIYVADSANHTIRKIAPNGTVTTVAGRASVPGNANGRGPAALFDSPSGLALDSTGNLFVSDTGNHTIRRVTPNGNVTTLAGSPGEPDAVDAPGQTARFNSPLGLAVDTAGVVFVADSGNHLIRRIALDGTVSTFAGNAENFGSDNGTGTNASFNNPVGLAFDAGGNLFVADANNHCLRKITRAGLVTTFAGSPTADGSTDGPGTTARFGKPAELAFDTRGNLFLTDAFNHTLRKVTPAAEVTTISGLAGQGGAGDGANRTARFLNPYGIAFNIQGHLLVSDTYNQTIRRVLIPFSITFDRSPTGASLLTWDAVTTLRYRVQFKDSFTSQPWQNLDAVITAAGLTASQLDPFPTPARFYRIQLVEP